MFLFLKTEYFYCGSSETMEKLALFNIEKLLYLLLSRLGTEVNRACPLNGE